MSETLNERSRKILEAIIEDHIASAEPVGSRTITRRHGLGVSPATVRNVMSDLEEMGYLVAPHTSSGRIPTEKGYRFYIDSLLQVRALSAQQKERIRRYCRRRGLHADELLREIGRVLSNLSHYTGIVMAPQFTASVFRHIEFVRLSQGRILAIFVAENGLVQNKIIESDEDLSRSDLEEMNNYLNRTYTGMSLPELKKRLVQEMSQDKALYDRLLRRSMTLFNAAFTEEDNREVFIEGVSRMFEQPEFSDLSRMKRLFKAFEQKSMLVEFLDKCRESQGVRIFIGSETEYREIEGCSLITASYSSADGGTIGTLGVIGPTRMAYSQVIPIVDYTAQLMSQLFESAKE
ncbi:heat-inducible transcription repressor HrcA [Geoalkalibacter ferrihydriticus]|uniref:Heat-inducible transcription repressor HrcA n=2 Tax=Geoalkalibacter ferrihydriticus TaxID=392333 RepID=A0A0C2HL16_9BACT|nr:heat-inducible transcriptional repressor HrcA [Geoalkalibacter ferrihydriticus]KIH77756.1 HrcA family transcriptional regulator [Geoalkalibacter ferrihydriticus DSM 17813]SDL77421.1 heat-inducible transcription repressor HrcA [Geoalkalibacter ferrihydriticus]